MVETHFDKSISVSWCNNVGVWGGVLSRRMPRGVSSDFTTFFLKIRVFKHILAYVSAETLVFYQSSLNTFKLFLLAG